MTTPPVQTVFFGVGFDTSRYGHHVTFLREDLQQACPPFEFAELRSGYERLRKQFEQLQQRSGDGAHTHFHIRIDAAGQYATNLETFLHGLPVRKTITVGEPARNQNYRKALFPKRKADPVESLCAARFALVEKPNPNPETAPPYQRLREIVQRLESQTRHSTRLTNQLHNLLARVFPELGLIVADLQANWILRLLERYPTPKQLARARPKTLAALPFVGTEKAERLQAAAASSVGSIDGPPAQSLVLQLVTQLRHSVAAEAELKDLLAEAYQQLPQVNHLDSIPGIGIGTAAILTAKMVAIERFATPEHVVGYFGVFPQEQSSGVGRDGQLRPGRQIHMSRQGNDLARKYLWNAAKCAIIHNPAVLALYRRLRQRGTRGDVALGHCMRKLLHLVFAVWRTGKPFDPQHYPWSPSPAANEKTAGHNQDQSPKVVTAVDSTVVAGPNDHKTDPAPVAVEASITHRHSGGGIDYTALREQISMEQVLAELGWLSRLKGSGAQRRGPCPLHASGDTRNRSFSVHFDKKVFHCFHPPCGARGNALDLWAAVHRLPLHEAAQSLAKALNLSLCSPAEQGRGTRRGTRSRRVDRQQEPST